MVLGSEPVEAEALEDVVHMSISRVCFRCYRPERVDRTALLRE